MAVTFDFQDQGSGLKGTTQAFGTGLNILSARGFTALDAPSALYVKSAGGDESGLGLNSDPSGDHEIAFGKGFVQINVDSLLLQNFGSFSFTMGSTTQQEGWKVYGSDDAHPFQFTLLASNTDAGGDEGSHTLAGGYDNYNFFYDGSASCGSGCNANVLLETFSAQVAAVPEPSTWAMMILGFAGIVFMGAKRRRENNHRAFRVA
jgi:hypothetical protein